MAIDLGTSFIKTGVYSLDGKLHASARKPVKSETPSTGVFIQRGDDLFDTVITCIKETTDALGNLAKDVAAIAFTGQMAGCIGVDENWQDITTWSCTLDNRYAPYADAQRKKHADLIFNISATSSQVMSAKLEWFKKEFPEEHKRIAKYLLLNGYMIGKMSRIPIDEAKIDYSLVTWTGLVDLRQRQWSKEICDALDVNPDILPLITSCTDIGGYLHPEIAAKVGLKAGLPLVLGAGDKVSGCVGAGVTDNGEYIYEAASYGAISCKTNKVKLDYDTKRFDVIGSIDDTGYYAHKYFQGSGVTLDWFVNEFYAEHGERSFKIADQDAKQIKAGSNKMLSIGLLGGGAMPFDSHLRGLFVGHTWSHSRGHFYRSLLESFAYELALSLRSIQSQYKDFHADKIMMIGGGSKSKVWPQILADVTGSVFSVLDRNDAALWGCALLAAKAIGDISDISYAAKEQVHVSTEYEPSETAHTTYQRYFALYEEVLLEMKSIYERISDLP